MGSLRVMVAGGGTGGHLFPAIAIASELRLLRPDAEFLFIGTKNRIEARVVPQHGFQFRPIWISGFQRRLTLANVLFPIKVIVSLVQSVSMIKKFRPDVVVGTGGYVCGPVLYAATLMKVPAAIQEQNSYPGVTTRLLAGRVDEVYLTFERSKQYVERARKVFITGNPTRADLGNVPLREALGYFGFSDKERKKTLLVFGGSLGARTINRAMMDCAGRLVGGGLRIVWQTGKEDLDAVKNACSGFPRDSVWIGAFIDRMDCAYAVCDLAVCRAGATTIAELTRLGKPAILVPYPFAAANHQAGNARSLVEAGAALLVCDQEAGARMERSVLELLDDARLKAMSEKSRELGKPDAARDIAKRIISLSDR